MGTIGDKGTKIYFLILFLPSKTLLLFNKKKIFPRHNFETNESKHWVISSISISNTRAALPAAIPTGNAFIVRPLSNRSSSSLYCFSWAIFWSVQTVMPLPPVRRLGLLWSLPFCEAEFPRRDSCREAGLARACLAIVHLLA